MAGLNETPTGERVQIALFGRRNAGKSSLLNALAGQELAIVSETRGTTTDPVKKSMELLPLGPVTLIDTPGLDDEGALGEKRIGKAREVLRRTDLALVVRDASETETEEDREILREIQARELPYLYILNKADLLEGANAAIVEEAEDSGEDALIKKGDSCKVASVDGTICHSEERSDEESRRIIPESKGILRSAQNDSDKYRSAQNDSGKAAIETATGHLPREGVKPGATMYVSALTGAGIRELKDAMAGMLSLGNDRPLIRDLLSPGDVVVLVVPIDKAAPKGRLILPQQQTIRDILEAGAQALVVRDTELPMALEALKNPPRMVVTDSQAFAKVSRIVPESVPLTSFSILMARYKGDLFGAVHGARAVRDLKDGDSVLIAEGCTHHRQCGDIGTEKLPNWIRKFTGCEPDFSWVSGVEFPEEVSKYKLVVHCGGCMLNAKEMQWRLGTCRAAGVPATNYGTLIAYIHGILDRSVAIFEGMGE